MERGSVTVTSSCGDAGRAFSVLFPSVGKYLHKRFGVTQKSESDLPEKITVFVENLERRTAASDDGEDFADRQVPSVIT